MQPINRTTRQGNPGQTAAPAAGGAPAYHQIAEGHGYRYHGSSTDSVGTRHSYTHPSGHRLDVMHHAKGGVSAAHGSPAASGVGHNWDKVSGGLGHGEELDIQLQQTHGTRPQQQRVPHGTPKGNPGQARPTAGPGHAQANTIHTQLERSVRGGHGPGVRQAVADHGTHINELLGGGKVAQAHHQQMYDAYNGLQQAVQRNDHAGALRHSRTIRDTVAAHEGSRQ